jgi:hypothetical protein
MGDKELPRTSSSIQPPSTSVTFEVFSLLMGDKDFEVIEISLAVITPWSREEFFKVWVTALLLHHCDWRLNSEIFSPGPDLSHPCNEHKLGKRCTKARGKEQRQAQCNGAGEVIAVSR